MWLVRKNHQARGAAIAANCFEELDRLQWRSARIRIFSAVHNQKRCLQLVCGEKRRDLLIHIRRLPYRARLILETERRERLVIRAAGGRSGPEQVGMRHQIYGH